MSDPRKQLEDGVHPEIVWDDYHAGKNPIDVLCDHLDKIERLQAQRKALLELVKDDAAREFGDPEDFGGWTAEDGYAEGLDDGEIAVCKRVLAILNGEALEQGGEE